MMETVGRIKEGNAMKPTSGGKKSAAKAGSRPQPMSLEKMEEENGKLAELLKQMKRPGQAAGLIEEKKREEVVVVGDEKIRQMVGIRDKLLVLGVEPSSLGSMDSGFNMYNEFCLESKIFSPWQQSDHQMSLFFVWNFLKKNSGATTQNHLNGVRNAWALNGSEPGNCGEVATLEGLGAVSLDPSHGLGVWKGKVELEGGKGQAHPHSRTGAAYVETRFCANCGEPGSGKVILAGNSGAGPGSEATRGGFQNLHCYGAQAWADPEGCAIHHEGRTAVLRLEVTGLFCHGDSEATGEELSGSGEVRDCDPQHSRAVLGD
jgi:hypothetical protein